jgi:hypothetical protein
VPNLLRGINHTLAALTSNGGAFHAAWREAAPGERWAGEWRSQANGHHGALRCVLRRRENGKWDAWFHARYARFLRVCYEVELAAPADGARFLLAGASDLGALAGGVYQYEGELSGDRLHCTYRCRYDHGAFSLARSG